MDDAALLEQLTATGQANTHGVFVRLPENVAEELATKAKSRRMSLSALAREIILGAGNEAVLLRLHLAAAKREVADLRRLLAQYERLLERAGIEEGRQ